MRGHAVRVRAMNGSDAPEVMAVYAEGLATGTAGMLLGTIGIDPQVGAPRFDFGQLWLLDGVDFIVLAVALFGVGEVLASCRMGAADPILNVGRVLPNREEWRQARMAIVRGSGIGFLIGILPAAGATIASFVAYIAEKKMASKDFAGARKIALKAQQLYPEIENISRMLIVCEVYCSAAKKLAGDDLDWY